MGFSLFSLAVGCLLLSAHHLSHALANHLSHALALALVHLNQVAKLEPRTRQPVTLVQTHPVPSPLLFEVRLPGAPISFSPPPAFRPVSPLPPSPPPPHRQSISGFEALLPDLPSTLSPLPILPASLLLPFSPPPLSPPTPHPQPRIASALVRELGDVSNGAPTSVTDDGGKRKDSEGGDDTGGGGRKRKAKQELTKRQISQARRDATLNINVKAETFTVRRDVMNCLWVDGRKGPKPLDDRRLYRLARSNALTKLVGTGRGNGRTVADIRRDVLENWPRTESTPVASVRVVGKS